MTDNALPLRCLVFSALTPEDPRAPNIRAIADANRDALVGSILVEGEGICRNELPELIARHQPPGVVFCGHGRPDGEALLHDGIALWDTENLGLCAGRWFHAIACYSAPELGRQALARGVLAFVGYNSLVWAYWQTDTLPRSARQVVARILSVASELLQQGERDEKVLRRAIRDACDAWVRWKNDHVRELKRLQRTFDSQAIDKLFQSLCMGLRLHAGGVEDEPAAAAEQQRDAEVARVPAVGAVVADGAHGGAAQGSSDLGVGHAAQAEVAGARGRGERWCV